MARDQALIVKNKQTKKHKWHHQQIAENSLTWDVSLQHNVVLLGPISMRFII